MDNEVWIGLISGTSADGIDAALVRFEPRLEVLAGSTQPYPEALRARLIEVSQHDAALSLDEFGALDHAVGAAFAAVAAPLVDLTKQRGWTLAAIGSHGQTLRHRPQGTQPFTMQIGDANLIAEATGCTTVADFRRRDVAAGGHGAPLLPGLHAAVFASPDEDRAVLNLGGIANLTLLPRQGVARGFDTGPANALLDAWCERVSGQRCDVDGRLAARGRIREELLSGWLADPWFALPPPKSTGRDQFHLPWLEQRSPRLAEYSVEDVQASLLALSAHTVADALRAQQPDTQRLIVCGGGVHNPLLMRALAERLPECAVQSSADHGLDPDLVEAVGFAWLARQTVRGLPGNLPSVTGARGPRVLGAIYPA